MGTPFLAEMRVFSFNFAPKGWAMCNGQLLPINQNQPLFSLLGTMFGGDGRVNFALPDLRDRVPMHFGNGSNLGERGGEQAHTVTSSEMPAHIHFAQATNTLADNVAATGLVFANPQLNAYTPAAALTTLMPSTVGNTGGSQAHENRSPYLVLNVCIALQGIFPSRN
jgi:microcystin-dependent protein